MTTTQTAPAPTAAPRLVGFRLNALNAPLYRITPLEGGLELTEHLLNTAHPYVYGNDPRRLVTPEELGVDVTAIEWIEEGAYAAHLGLSLGTHRARVASTPEQRELAAECSAQGRTIPAKGDRFVVAILEGYKLIQNRDLDHRHCGCGNGSTTYAAGVVSSVTYYADNSIEAVVELEGRPSHRVTLVAPHGDACF